MQKNNDQARIAAILILVMAVIAPVCMMYVPSQLIVTGDISTTAINIRSNASLFHFGITCETLICLLEIAISVLLYRIFEKANKTLAMVALSSRLAMTVIQGVNALIHISASALLNNQAAMTEMGTVQSNALLSLLLHGHDSGVYVWQIFFGLHLLSLGYLAYKSGYVPKLIGIAPIIASLGYLANSYAGIWASTSATVGSFVSILLVLSTIGELLFTFWLLIKGVGVAQEQ